MSHLTLFSYQNKTLLPLINSHLIIDIFYRKFFMKRESMKFSVIYMVYNFDELLEIISIISRVKTQKNIIFFEYWPYSGILSIVTLTSIDVNWPLYMSNFIKKFQNPIKPRDFVTNFAPGQIYNTKTDKNLEN